MTQAIDIDNLIYLDTITLDNVLHILQNRLYNKKIYTDLGSVLISINPYEYFTGKNDIYAFDNESHYREAHLWKTMKHIYHRLFDDVLQKPNQSIIVSGESGSGKTETVKQIIHFLQHNTQSNELMSKIEASGHVLECFGNAATSRNNNSSRFGKFIEVAYTSSHGCCGMKTTIYLLEKTRLFCHNPAEQFHVFSKTTGEIEILLQNAGFDATSQSTFVLRLYELVKSFMSANKYDPSFMPSFLSKKKTVIGDEVIERTYEANEFIEMRNTLVMKLYETLFHWIVDTMNTLYTTMTTTESIIYTNNPSRTLGILDIFGFENLEYNHLEQLMINYTNEILQQLLNTIVIADRATLYQSEGIVDDCPYVSPIFQIQLIDTIFDDINEECMLPQGNIRGCMMKLKKKNMPGFITNKISAHEKFTVQHYAGDIEYTTSEFMERNMDRSNNEIDQYINDLFNKTPKRRGSVVGKVKMNSITTQYRNNVREFITKMNACELHFIKCIKPNALAVPLEFDDTIVRTQLEYNGILQFIHILKQGFSHHIPHDTFKINFGRYIQPDDVIKYLDTTIDEKDIKYSAVYGRTCVFLTDEYYDALSKRKYVACLDAISRISGVYIRYKTKRFIMYKKAAYYLQHIWKRHIGRTRCRIFILRHICFNRYYKQLEFIIQQEQDVQEQDVQEQDVQEQDAQEHTQSIRQPILNPMYDPLIHPDPNKLAEDLALCRRQLAIREAEEKQYIACISQLKRERDILLQQIAYLRNECKKGWFHRFFNN